MWQCFLILFMKKLGLFKVYVFPKFVCATVNLFQVHFFFSRFSVLCIIMLFIKFNHNELFFWL